MSQDLEANKNRRSAKGAQSGSCTVDLAVIGGGGGLAGAIAAAENGAKVVLLEKRKKTGGNVSLAFASGNDTAGWVAQTYPFVLSGTALSFAINSARIAGENAAEYASSATTTQGARTTREKRRAT
jgi:monoamine oxidase